MAEALLAHPSAVEHNGIVYVVGIRGGEYVIRRLNLANETWLEYGDGSEEKSVAPVACDQRAALVKLVGQGSPLLVGIPRWPHVVFYCSYDDGETWTEESAI